MLVVFPRLAVANLAAVRISEVDTRVGECSGQLGEAVGGEFVIVVDLDQDIASAGLAGELLQFADVLRLAGIGDVTGLGEINVDLARVAVGDDHPFEVGECLVRDGAGQAARRARNCGLWFGQKQCYHYFAKPWEETILMATVRGSSQ